MFVVLVDFDSLSLYDFDIWFWNFSDSLVPPHPLYILLVHSEMLWVKYVFVELCIFCLFYKRIEYIYAVVFTCVE